MTCSSNQSAAYPCLLLSLTAGVATAQDGSARMPVTARTAAVFPVDVIDSSCLSWVDYDADGLEEDPEGLEGREQLVVAGRLSVGDLKA